MMKTILKYLAVVGLLAHGAFGLGSFQEFPAKGNVLGYIYNCDMGNDGSVYYELSAVSAIPTYMGEGIFVKKNDNNPAQNLLSYLPSSFVGKDYGVYYDSSRDSLYVGGQGGQVYRGRGTTFTAMPTIPLKYSKLEPMGAYVLPYTHVRDFIRDSKDRLLALTDSLVWYLDESKQEWKTVGSAADYTKPYGFNEAMLHSNGDVFIAGGTREGSARMHVIHPDLSIEVLLPWQYGRGMILGQNGTFYATAGGLQQYVRFNPSTGFKPDTINPIYPITESRSGYWSGTIFEDKSGLLWQGQSTRVLLFDGVNRLATIPHTLGMAVNFLIAPDSTFWVCANDGLLRYSEKYRIPPEIATSVRQSPNAQELKVTNIGRGIRLHSPQQQRIRIVSIRGHIAFDDQVVGDQIVPLSSGIWVITGPSIRKTVVIYE